MWAWGRLRHSPGRHKTPSVGIYASRPEYAPAGRNIVIQALLAGASPFWAGIGSSWPIPAGPALPPSRLGRRHTCRLGWASAKISRLGWLPQSRLGRPGLVRALPPGRVKRAAPASSALPSGRAGAGRPGLVQLSPGPRPGRSGRFRPFRIAFSQVRR
jgi:hypothetical protein